MWNSSCLDSLLFSMHNHSPTTIVNDPAWVVTIRSLYQKVVREWIIRSLSHAPCTSQGLLQVGYCTFPSCVNFFLLLSFLVADKQRMHIYANFLVWSRLAFLLPLLKYHFLYMRIFWLDFSFISKIWKVNKMYF